MRSCPTRSCLPVDNGLPVNIAYRKACLLVLEPASPRENYGDVSWVVSTPRSPVPASLHLLALQPKPSLSGLRAPERSFFVPCIMVFIQVTQQGCKWLEFDRQRGGNYTTICTFLLVRRCLICYPALAFRLFDRRAYQIIYNVIGKRSHYLIG